MSTESVETIIIGAGLAGLSAALHLHEAGRKVLVLEAADAVGGRVRTDHEDGFLLDRGFQVYLDAYPEAGELLDLEALDLHAFEPGALIWKKGKLRRLMDVFRRPGELFSSALQPIGTPFDKLLVAKLRRRLLRKSQDAIWSAPESTTADYLRRFGFSEGMIDLFFRGFYGGIFLEDQLVTSSRMFEFTFGMFSRGHATLPAAGMQAIPNQLATRLPAGTVRLECPVESISGSIIRAGGQEITAGRIILATDGSTSARLLPDRFTAPRWNGTTCLYFAALEPPYLDALIALRGDRKGLINNICVPSNVAPTYAPPGETLISVSITGYQIPDVDLTGRVRSELREWFGPAAADWRFLKAYHLPQSLPIEAPGHAATLEKGGPVLACGDFLSSASIEGAIRSGRLATDAILDGDSRPAA
jgi:phytoene dehydrogenase-like protein